MSKDFKCNLCSKEYYSRYNLNVHVSKHAGTSYVENNFKCSVCYYETFAESHLINHMRKHTGEQPFKCTVIGCGKAFTIESNLRRHIKFTHTEGRPFKCEFPGCGRRVKTTVALNLHVKVHSDDKPFLCPNAGCSFRAKRKAYVTRHVRIIHTKAKGFSCSECDYKTARRDHLRKHIRRHIKKHFKCSHPRCTAAFSSSYNLELHFWNRHESKKYKCDHPGCARKYSNANDLYYHKLDCHSSKNLVCANPKCSYRTTTAEKLGRHMIMHERMNEKIPCSMEGCAYVGKNFKALRCHMSHHKILFRCPVSTCGRYVTKKALECHQKLHNSLGRPFQCPLCLKCYATLIRLNTHSVVHTKEKLFKCGHCETLTSSRFAVKNHIYTQHANIKFPFITLPLNVCECLHCNMTLPLAEFVVHSMGHTVPVVVLERLETRWL